MITTCTHGHVLNGCMTAGCPHNPFGWVLNTDTLTACDHGYLGGCPRCRTARVEETHECVDGKIRPYPAVWCSRGCVMSDRASPIIPMGADSTPERRLFHQVEAPERRPGSLDIPSIEQRARRAVLRGDADREGVRAMGRDVLLLIEALREGTH